MRPGRTLSRPASAWWVGGLILPLLIVAPAAAPQGGPLLLALTLNTGTVVIAEPMYESSGEIKVYNLETAEEESFPKAKGFKRVSAAEAKYLTTKMGAAGGKVERLEALYARPLKSAAPELFSRLGRYPENAANYLAWAARRIVPADGDRPGTLAVLPFQDTRGAVTGETTRRTEEITNALVRRQTPLVERGQFSKVMMELHLETGQVFDQSTAQKAGRQLGAGAILIGTLVPRGSKADLNLRLIETETGRLLDAPTITDVPRGGSTAPRNNPVPSLVGTWELSGPNGMKADFFCKGNGRCSTSNGWSGTWTQSGLNIAWVLRGPVPGKRELSPPRRSEGAIDPDGLQLHVQVVGGRAWTGVRK